MDYKYLIVEKEDQIAKVTIHRPEALNALNPDVMSEINACVDDIIADDNVRVVIFTGEGRSFVAGADIAYMADADVASGREYCAYGAKVFRKIETMDKISIAAVNGFALGGGCELSMACDLRIASTKATFGQPEVGLGIIPGYSGTQRLPRLVGAGIAKELIYTARNIKADEAYRIGLVNKVVEPEELMDETMKMAKAITKNAPYAVVAAKAAITRGLDMDMESAVIYENYVCGSTFATEDRVEGMKAFMEKRPANFKNK